METTPRTAIIGAGRGMNDKDRDTDREGNRRSRSRGTELARRYRYARKYDLLSYHGSSSQKTTRFASPDRWRGRRFGPRFL